MITRSTKGTIIIDNNLTNYIKSSETSFNGTYNSLSSLVKKFRDKRIPEIKEAIKNSPIFYDRKRIIITNNKS